MNPSTRVYYLHNANDVNGSMTNRDYIAIHAMQAIVASPNFNNTDTAAVAKDAYRMADAMIEQSEVKDEQSI